MQINKEQLIELLVQKTGLRQDQVEEQLSELITRVQQAAEQGKSFEIEKFGIFSVEEGELRFEPAEEFKTEINNKYAGMEPIEMIGAYEEAEDVEKPDADSDRKEDDSENIWGWDGDEDEIADEAPDVVDESSEESAMPESDSEEPEEEPAEEPFKPSFELAESEEAVEEEVDVESEEQEDEPEEPVAAGTKTKKQFKTPGYPHRRKKSSSPRIVIIAAAVLIVALAGAVAAWFVTVDVTDDSNGSLSGNQQSSISTSQIPQPDPVHTDEVGESVQSQQDEAPAESEPTLPPRDNQQNRQAGSEPEQENTVAEGEGDQTAPAVYGLKGELNANANEGYTIVVHSLRDEDKARGLYNDFKEEGYRTHLVSAIVGGEEFWRVGLGQFRTVDDADSTAGQLPGPLSNNYFIKRIQ